MITIAIPGIMEQRRRNELAYMDIPFLTSNGFTFGFIEAFHRNRSKVYHAYCIWDNSGTMTKFDGMRICMSSGRIRFLRCTRWKELSETALFQIDLAAAIRAPTTHRLLNHPGHNAREQIFSIASTPEDTTLEHDVSLASATIQQVKPSGHTPLTEHVQAIRAIVEPMNEHLRTNGKKIAIVIATDGLPTNEYGEATKQAHDLFMAEMRALGRYEVFVVVRLCTNESRVVDFWNGLDKNPELKLDVLDDYLSEAKEVHAKNPWLTYGLSLHHLREMGFDDEVLDDLDERPYSIPEIQEFLTILLGQVVLPDPDVNWRNFCDQVEEYVSREQMPYNPIYGRTTPWINMRELRRMNPRRRWFRL